MSVVSVTGLRWKANWKNRMKNDGGPAFPKYWHSQYEGEPDIKYEGMSLRDYFAAAALQSLLGEHFFRNCSIANQPANVVAAKTCYDLADEMLKERQKCQTP